VKTTHSGKNKARLVQHTHHVLSFDTFRRLVGNVQDTTQKYMSKKTEYECTRDTLLLVSTSLGMNEESSPLLESEDDLVVATRFQ
jgi:hypothetical protein